MAQEADSGFNLRTTLSGQAAASSLLTEDPRSGSPGTAGFRSVFYPTWKLSDHWAVTGAWQLYSHPYFFGSFSTTGYGANGNLLQATLDYSRVSDKGSILLRAGQLSTAFGSFPLHYDDAENVLIDTPLEYSYYDPLVSTLGVAGAQVDASRGKWDGRVQFVNSSPANPRSLFAHDQFGNWAGGGGYTIRQGLRVGASAYRGPYLDSDYEYFPYGRANPTSFPARALGIDIQWAHRHWNVQGELQHFVMPYPAMPTLRVQAGYAEAKLTLNPRWYIAARGGYERSNPQNYLESPQTTSPGDVESIETAAGFRLNRRQLIKADFELNEKTPGEYRFGKTVAIQFVTTLQFSAARK